MTEDPHLGQHVAATAFQWGPFLQGWLVAIGTFLAGLYPFIQWVKKRREAREEKIRNDMRKRLEEEMAADKEKSSKHVEIKDFDDFKRENRAQHDELGHIVQDAAHKANDANQAIKEIAEKIREDNQKAAGELRETLTVFKMGIETSLGSVHDKANEANIKVATLDGRVSALEKRQAS